MLNPKSITCIASDATLANVPAALDAVIATAVTAAKAATTAANQIEITPTGLIFYGTNYVGTATVVYPG